MLHNAFEFFIEGFRSLIAAGYGVFRAADLIHDFNFGEPIGRRVLDYDVTLFIKGNIALGCVIGTGF